MSTQPRAYRGWFGRFARRRCPHSDLLPHYGDAINVCGGWRLWCYQCRRHVDGPADLAESRTREHSHA